MADHYSTPRSPFAGSFFSDITSQYVTSFLPAYTIERGMTSPTQTEYVFRLRKGVYLVHPDALDDAIAAIIYASVDGDELGVREAMECYEF